MIIKFSPKADKFLEKIIKKDKSRIQQKVNSLIQSIEGRGIIPFKELDIKKLSGDWLGFYRMRIGKMRLIFRIDRLNDTLVIYEIDFRGGIYK